MRPSRNAFKGYTYQEQITFLFLVMMDVERNFNSLEIEAKVDNNFDDIKIINDIESIYFQIKDFDEISLSNLKFSKGEVDIKGKKHSLSANGRNVLIFKNINIKPSFEIFGLPALKLNGVYIISLSRIEADDIINKLYSSNGERRLTIARFFSKCLDDKIFKIKREDLPIIKVFDTKLLELTIDVGKKRLEFSKILFIEGNPGIGKSHYVNTLSKVYKNNIIYRFWISEQDKDKNIRLKYKNFLFDISKKLFDDYKNRSELEIIEKISKSNKTVIIDGLDHVENYNEIELESFIQFINNLSSKCKTIILSRPLKYQIEWDKQILSNWNQKNTHKVLNELYHIIDYKTCNKIYELTNGYPILVRFISEHYKTFNEVLSIEKLKDVEDYYSKIIKDVNTKSALTLFLTSRAFFMKSELSLFLSDELYDCINEFINAYPYLFEVRLNRISLFHDSFNKHLKELGINFSKRKEKVDKIVYKSIINGEKKFLSRFSHFDFDDKMSLDIIRKFSSINIFKEIVNDCIDFEAIRSFYFQLRESLSAVSPNDLEIVNYYDLALITNIVNRDHISSLNSFLYTYVKCLIFNGFDIENITSSEYLFGMFTFVIENDSTILYNVTSNDAYGTERFQVILEQDILSEDNFFNKQSKPFKLKYKIDYYFEDEFRRSKVVTDILVNLFIHGTEDKSLIELENCIKIFVNSDEDIGISILSDFIKKYNWESYRPRWILNDAKKILLSLGLIAIENNYLNLTLKEYISRTSHIGSFDLWVNLLSYMRLSLHQERKIDITSINSFWTMYNMRKDYSVINIDVALKIFEENGLLKEEASINKIVYTQSMSEKGIRHLLANYTRIHSPKIIRKLLDIYDFEELEISWFDLPSEHINLFPESLYNKVAIKLLRNNNYNKKIDFNEIRNVYSSSKWPSLLSNLKFHRYSISINENSIEIEKLKKLNILIDINKEDKKDFYDSSYRYNKGILNSKDKEFIIENKLSILDVSGYLNGNYSALAELDVYNVFEKNEVSRNLKNIIYNAILGKVNTINRYGSIYHFVGNLPKLVNDYSSEPNILELYKSFDTFMELSLLNKSNEAS